MHRFFAADPEIKDNKLNLAGDEWHHCRTVLRRGNGARIILFDGKGNEYLAEIYEATAQYAVLNLLKKTTTPRPTTAITLAQALPKKKAMDLIVQKATELGVYEIVPLLSNQSVVKIKPSEAHSKTMRWREISIEAAKQCGSNWLPCITPPQAFREVIATPSRYHLCLIGSLQNDAQPLWSYLADLKAAPLSILLMIGPEGDFAPAEIEFARHYGFRPLSLGPHILRCETAALYALSILNYEVSRLH